MAQTQTEYLFAYGRLQSDAVQLATFHRKLDGRPDALIGYIVETIEIKNEAFVASSGTAHHRNLRFTGRSSDIVEGTAFSLTAHELALADSYEPPGYNRTQVKLRSGSTAWVYVNNGQC